MKFTLPTFLSGPMVRLLSVALFAQGAVQAQNTFPATGNVGIGTTTPTYRLTLGAGINSIMGLDNAGYFTARNAAGTYEVAYIPRWTDNATYLDYGSAGFNIRINGGTATTMHMNNAGNVGIGTTAPAYRLTIGGGVNGVIGMDNAASIVARNAAGAYENFLWPRFIDNITYLNYGSGGFRIRTNASTVAMAMDNAGRVGIGTVPTTAALSVRGTILSEQVRVRIASTWPDYVFRPSYRLAPLAEVEQYIRTHGHLPNIPSAAEVEKEGSVELGAMNARLLEKVEELTLYLIEEKKAREREVAGLKEQLDQLKGNRK